MITTKIVRICAGCIPPAAVFTFIVGCSQSSMQKADELYDEVARYACYNAAGAKATLALHAACPDLPTDVPGLVVGCPIVDQVVAVLERDLEACDGE